ncbi:hypothetical protein CHARACLAT_002787 [Characodon lateralis]|uniref:Uncharacterized protein n=1 Tax=Characodon lateralis TaxID=208331 RepID=A0ABU7ES45_9TELE|nr:hypothetical protein [Characodon lateralis]
MRTTQPRKKPTLQSIPFPLVFSLLPPHLLKLTSKFTSDFPPKNLLIAPPIAPHWICCLDLTTPTALLSCLSTFHSCTVVFIFFSGTTRQTPLANHIPQSANISLLPFKPHSLLEISLRPPSNRIWTLDHFLTWQLLLRHPPVCSSATCSPSYGPTWTIGTLQPNLHRRSVPDLHLSPGGSISTRTPDDRHVPTPRIPV